MILLPRFHIPMKKQVDVQMHNSPSHHLSMVQEYGSVNAPADDRIVKSLFIKFSPFFFFQISLRAHSILQTKMG